MKDELTVDVLQENPVQKASFQVPEGEHKSLQGIESWSFDIFQVEDDQLPQVFTTLLNLFNVIRSNLQ